MESLSLPLTETTASLPAAAAHTSTIWLTTHWRPPNCCAHYHCVVRLPLHFPPIRARACVMRCCAFGGLSLMNRGV